MFPRTESHALAGLVAVCALALGGCADDEVDITLLSTPPIDAVVTNEKITLTAGTAIEIHIDYCNNYELDEGDLEGWAVSGPIHFTPLDEAKENFLDGNYVLAGISAGDGAISAIIKKGGAVIDVEVRPQEGL